MSDALKRQLLEFKISETDEARGYWLDKPWIAEDRRLALVSASILALPTLQEAEPPTFPVGSGEFIARLQTLVGQSHPLAVAMSSEDYVELALHSKAWRLPTLLVTTVVLPIILGILTNRLDEVLPGHKADDTAEVQFIIETPDRGALKVTYKGPAKEMGSFLENSVARYIDSAVAPAPAPQAPVPPPAPPKQK